MLTTLFSNTNEQETILVFIINKIVDFIDYYGLFDRFCVNYGYEEPYYNDINYNMKYNINFHDYT